MKTAKYALVLALGLILLVVPRAAHADSVVFTASGTFADGAALGGTLTIDTSSGTIVSSDLTTTESSAPGPFSVIFPSRFNTSLGGIFEINVDDASESHDLILALPIITTLVGYAGGSLCGSSAPCIDGTFTNVSFVQGNLLAEKLSSGTLTAAPVPEPSSLFLLGTGLLGLAGAMRRKWFA